MGLADENRLSCGCRNSPRFRNDLENWTGEAKRNIFSFRNVFWADIFFCVCRRWLTSLRDLRSSADRFENSLESQFSYSRGQKISAVIVDIRGLKILILSNTCCYRRYPWAEVFNTYLSLLLCVGMYIRGLKILIYISFIYVPVVIGDIHGLKILIQSGTCCYVCFRGVNILI
jgi:hypothetical protein